MPDTGIHPGHLEMIAGFIGDAAVLHPGADRAVFFEYFRIELKRLRVGLRHQFEFAASVVGGPQIAPDGGGVGRELQGLVVARNRTAVFLLGIKNSAHVIDGIGILLVQLDGVFVGFAGAVQVTQLMVRDADLVP